MDGNAEITQVLKVDGAGDSDTVPDLISQRVDELARMSRRPINADDAKSDELKDFGLTARTSVLLVVVECTSGSFDISFDKRFRCGYRRNGFVRLSR